MTSPASISASSFWASALASGLKPAWPAPTAVGSMLEPRVLAIMPTTSEVLHRLPLDRRLPATLPGFRQPLN